MSSKIKVIVQTGFSGPLVGAWGAGECLMPEWVARKMAPSGLVVILEQPASKAAPKKAAEKEAPATTTRKTRTRTRKSKK